MTCTSTVLILGARGRLGLAAARAFAQAGWRVCAQIRPGATGPTVPGVEWLAHDLQDTAGLAAAARGARVVVHALNPAYTVAAWREQAPGLMAAALALATELRATLMLPGNVYNYGEDMPAVLQEATPQRPRHELGRIRVALEQQMAQAVKDSGGAMRAVVLRAGNFFGASEGTFLDKMVAPQLPRGKASWMGDLDVSTPWAYLPDLARTLVMLAERNDLAPFETFHFAGHQVSARQWLAVLSQVAQEQGWLQPGQALTVRRVPVWFFRLFGLASATLATIAQTSYLFSTPHRLDNTRLVQRLGAEPRTPFELAVRQSLVTMRLPLAEAPEALAA